MRRVPVAAALVAVVLSFATPSPADASIVIGEHIGGIRLGDTLTEVTARHGAPSRRLVGDEPGDYGLFWDRLRLHAVMLTAYDSVLLVSTTSATQRTSRHIGPGVRARTARARLRGERCERYFDADRRRDVVGCDVNSSGGVVTSFVIWSGKVREVVLSITIGSSAGRGRRASPAAPR